MKEEIEKAVQGWLNSVQYNGGPLVDDVLRGNLGTPTGQSFAYIDFKEPANDRKEGLGMGMAAQVTGLGQIIFFFKRDSTTNTFTPEIVDRADRVPGIVYDCMDNDKTLSGALNEMGGLVTPQKEEHGLYEQKNIEGSFFIIGYIQFQYKGSWVMDCAVDGKNYTFSD